MVATELTERLVICGRSERADLPWPIGYGGLPKDEVARAEAVMDRSGVTGPVLKKYNVLAWLRGYYQDRGENLGGLYESIVEEQLRLGRILDPGPSEHRSQPACPVCREAGRQIENLTTGLTGIKTMELNRAA